MGRLWEVNRGSAATTRRFLYDGDALVAEYDALGNITDRYVRGVGDDVPLIWYDGATLSDATRLQLFANWQGSIVTMVRGNATRETVQINGYDEWGVPNETNLGAFQYTGQVWLPELELYHYKARAYSPWLGRFMQTDPIGYEDQVNLYAYVGNDPVNGTDFAGTCKNGKGSDCPQLRPSGPPASGRGRPQSGQTGGDFGGAGANGSWEGGSGPAGNDQTITVYRAVSPEEFQDISETGEFRNPEGTEVKYFSLTREGAEKFGQMAQKRFGDDPKTVVSGEISPQGLLKSDLLMVDGGIPTLVVPTAALPEVSLNALPRPPPQLEERRQR